MDTAFSLQSHTQPDWENKTERKENARGKQEDYPNCKSDWLLRDLSLRIPRESRKICPRAADALEAAIPFAAASFLGRRLGRGLGGA
eukprot:6106295-Pyramimonas_sp.AAC.1